MPETAATSAPPVVVLTKLPEAMEVMAKLVVVAAVSKVFANSVVEESWAPLVALKKPPTVVEAVIASEPEEVAEPKSVEPMRVVDASRLASVELS